MTTTEERYEAALGSFLGACAGDAAGVVLRAFADYQPSIAEVNDAMTMPGGGLSGGPVDRSRMTVNSRCVWHKLWQTAKISGWKPLRAIMPNGLSQILLT